MGSTGRHLGIAGVINGISNVHEAFLNDGGLGIVVGDGKLPHPGLEQIIEIKLTAEEDAALKKSAAAVKELCAVIGV